MRPSDVVRRSATYLERHGVQSPRETAEVLLAHVLGIDRAGIYARAEGLDTREARAFGRALCRRCSGEPVQHVTGEQAFFGRTFRVVPGVFVPRPETEVVVETVLRALEFVSAPVVADIGTGTGAVAVSVAAERPDACVLATDTNPLAVQLARENADRHGVAVDVVEGDLMTPIDARWRGLVDVVVSNPPYLDESAAGSLPADVLADPPEALFGGTAVHARLAAAARSWLRDTGRLVMEIGDDQASAVTAILRERGFADVGVERDLAGRDRVVSGVHRAAS